MSKINIGIDTKKALVINGIRLTDYIYDDVLETENEYILYSKTILHIYDKSTGSRLFEYVGKSFVVNKNYIFINEDDKYYLYTTRGVEFSKKPFDTFNELGKEYICVYRGDKAGVYSFNGDKIVSCEYQRIRLCSDVIEAHFDYDYIHLYSLKGKLIYTVNKEKDTWLRIVAGILTKNSSDKCGLYSIDGRVILSEVYDEIDVSRMYEFNKLECLTVKKNGKYGVVNFKGKEILPIEFDDIQIAEGIPHSCNNFLLVKRNGKYGIYSSNGEMKVPVEYDHFKSYLRTGTTCNACKNGIWGYYIIHKKKFVIADDISITKTGKYEFLIDGKWKELEI